MWSLYVPDPNGDASCLAISLIPTPGLREAEEGPEERQQPGVQVRGAGAGGEVQDPGEQHRVQTHQSFHLRSVCEGETNVNIGLSGVFHLLLLVIDLHPLKPSAAHCLIRFFVCLTICFPPSIILLFLWLIFQKCSLMLQIPYGRRYSNDNAEYYYGWVFCQSGFLSYYDSASLGFFLHENSVVLICTCSPGQGKEAAASVKDDKEGGASTSAGTSAAVDPDKSLPSFWIPSLTPVAKPTLLKKPVRETRMTPMLHTSSCHGWTILGGKTPMKKVPNAVYCSNI